MGVKDIFTKQGVRDLNRMYPSKRSEPWVMPPEKAMPTHDPARADRCTNPDCTICPYADPYVEGLRTRR